MNKIVLTFIALLIILKPMPRTVVELYKFVLIKKPKLDSFSL